MNFMKSSYKEDDVKILLSDVTDSVKPVSMEERKRLIAGGKPTRSVLIEEYPMECAYVQIVEENMEEFVPQTAHAVGRMAEAMYALKGRDLVIVDIARAGLPIGILAKRYLKKYHGIDVPHYSISLIDGPDVAAMEYIIAEHGAKGILFVDGWTGKGTVAGEIHKYVCQNWKEVKPMTAMLSDCIQKADICGTIEDIYIPHSPLNAIATGLVSITVKLAKDENAFHSAAYLKDLECFDISREYVDMVCKEFSKCDTGIMQNNLMFHKAEALKASKMLGRDMSLLNPGVNESARALLRRSLEKLVVSDLKDPQVKVLLMLAEEKGVPVETMELERYRAISVANDGYMR